MRLIKVRFTVGLDCEAYQDIDIRGVCTRYLDLDGNELVLPEVTESHVINDNPELPSWAQ